MRHFLNGPVRWVALGAGVLALAGVISVAVWLVQRGDGPGAVTEAASDGANPSTGPASSDATLSDSVELDVQGGGPATDETEAVQTEDAAGAGLTAADEATVSDSVEWRYSTAKPPPVKRKGCSMRTTPRPTSRMVRT